MAYANEMLINVERVTKEKAKRARVKKKAASDNPLKEVRFQVASAMGLLHRVASRLGLERQSSTEMMDALRAWCEDDERKWSKDD